MDETQIGKRALEEAKEILNGVRKGKASEPCGGRNNRGMEDGERHNRQTANRNNCPIQTSNRAPGEAVRSRAKNASSNTMDDTTIRIQSSIVLVVDRYVPIYKETAFWL